jgi:DNA gyrase subunit A
MLALVNNEPKILNLYDMLHYYLEHQKEVVTRRTQYELNKAEERAHILQGLLIALDNIDRVIEIIRGSGNVAEAKNGLMTEFSLSDAQAQAIVDMRLRALTGLEREKLENEYKELMEKIAYYKSILGNQKILLGVIKEELIVVRDKYGDDRRTKIGYDEGDIDVEDLIKKENTIIAMTHMGYIKRMTVDNFKSQNRGGKGIKGMSTIEGDFIEDIIMGTTHHFIMFFTNKGRVYRLKAWEIPESSRTARGNAIVNLLQLQAGEHVTAMIPISEYKEGHYLFMATKNGMVKKTPINEFENIRKNGLAAITLKDGDDLIEVKRTNDKKDIIMVTKYGMCIRFKETDVRPTGRTSMGVIGMNLSQGDEIVAMQLDTQGNDILFVSENGMGKRTNIDEFTPQHRGGKGVKCYKITSKTGEIKGAKAVKENNEIMLITTAGTIIRMQVSGISELGRITSGVKLINLDDTTVASITRVRESTSEEALKELEDQMNEHDGKYVPKDN